jgi:hypothetical protein
MRDTRCFFIGRHREDVAIVEIEKHGPSGVVVINIVPRR